MTRDMRRRERRAQEVAFAAAQERDDWIDPPKALDVDRLAEAMGSLSERERAVVLLTFQEDRSAQEIGQAFGLEAGHVRVIRHRALGRLAAIMGVDELGAETGAA